jgi:hypothetical protein
MLSKEEITELRDQNYHRTPQLALKDSNQACSFINAVGFSFLFPQKGKELPSLWEAINGNSRPIPHRHNDDALRLAWSWKDVLPLERKLYYGKYIHRKPTLISLDLLPAFYALSDNFGGLDDYLDSYAMGKMSEEAKRIYEVLLELGPSPTGALRRQSGLFGQQNSSRFDRAITELQSGFWIVKCGISDANRWEYSYVYDLLPRWLPEQVERGVAMSSRQGMEEIVTRYIKTVVVSKPELIARLFQWPVERLERVLHHAKEAGRIVEVEVAEDGGRWLTCASDA